MAIMGSQAGQDKFVLSIFEEGHRGFFLDLGCYDPEFLSNTLLLEQQGWTGLAFDICDYTEKWKIRTTPFINADVTTCDFSQYGIPEIIDYVSIDIDTIGKNYYTLHRLINRGYKFKVITIEHNLYQGAEYNNKERIPQRTLLSTEGYQLIKPDVEYGGNKFEDWWVNFNLI